MTRLVTCGFETGDINENFGISSNTNSTAAMATSSPTPRSPGVYCVKEISATSSQANAYRAWDLGVGKSELWIRWAAYLHGYAAVASGNAWLLYLVNPSNFIQATVYWDSTAQTLSACRGASTVLGTSTQTLSQDAWHTIEVHWKSSTTVGVSEVWVDGVRWLNLTGVNNAQQADTTMQKVQIGHPFGTAGVFLQANGAYIALDDIAINDASGTINNGQIGDGRVVLLKPNGAGSSTVLTRGGTNTGANWSQTNEIPPSAAQYVSSSNPGDQDTYALEDIPSGSWSVNCVEELVMAQNDTFGSGSLGLTIKSGATTNEGTAQALGTGPAYYRQLYETDPNTSAAWTNAAVNALEAGATVR